MTRSEEVVVMQRLRVAFKSLSADRRRQLVRQLQEEHACWGLASTEAEEDATQRANRAQGERARLRAALDRANEIIGEQADEASRLQRELDGRIT
jgi:ribonuclease HII